jgi:flagellar M-ring protein FliF
MGDDLPLKGQVGFELFNKSDMGLTDFAQKINYQRALQGELARTIMTMDSIESARVHLSIGEHSIFRDDRVPPKASVILVPRADHRITLPTIQGIQRLVAAAVPELEPANVVVVDASGRVVGDEAGADEVAESSEQRQVEERYEQQVRGAIAGIASAEASVRVSAGPSARYEQILSATPTASGGAGADRDFPLHVTIGLPAPVSQDIEDQLRASTLAAVGRAEAGDVVTVTVASPVDPAADALAEAAPARVARSGSDRAAPANPERDISGTALWAGFGAIVLLLLLVGFRRRGAPRPLREAERDLYVSRFHALLEEEHARA